jgi:tetratricopeptide (TPR) repeat protein
VRKNYDAAADAYATTFAEIDVACEACHGPGSAHVQWAEARRGDVSAVGASEAEASRDSAPGGAVPDRGLTGGDVSPARAAGMTADQMGLQVRFPRLADAAWNIDPRTGLAQREPAAAPAFDVELCGRCHSRRGPIADGYRYGTPVSDFYRVALLEDGLYHADGQILDEVFVYGSFRQSRMYRAGVACADCHEPHSLQPYSDGNALCNRCHLGATFDTPEHHYHEPGTPGASCVACHMPATTYMVVDPRRDHSFRVPRPDMSREYGTPNACADCHADRGDGWAAEAVERWFGSERAASPGARLAAGRGRQPGAQAELRALAIDAAAPGIVRATAFSLLAVRTQAAVGAVTIGLQDADPQVRSGALAALEGADPATLLRLALPLLADANRTVRLEAARLMATVPPPSIPAARRAEVAAALDEYRGAQGVNEDRAQARLNLGWLALQQGDLTLAEQEYRTALRLEPMFVPGYINLADLYRAMGRDAEGEAPLRRALEIAPDSGDVHHALGLLLVRLERRDEAHTALRRAAELAPANPRYLYVYAVAVQSGGDTAAALRILEDGLERFPAEPDLLAAAATFSREAGELQRAIAYARRLVDLDPADPRAAALLQELTGGR